MESNYTPDQIERLWQYRNGVITYFNSFVNSFLVAESVLLAVVGMIASSNQPMANVKFPIITRNGVKLRMGSSLRLTLARKNGVKSTVDPCSCSKLIRVKGRLDPFFQLFLACYSV